MQNIDTVPLFRTAPPMAAAKDRATDAPEVAADAEVWRQRVATTNPTAGRDITSYVGETVSIDVWEALHERLPERWEFDGYEVDGGWHITRLTAKPPDDTPWFEVQ